MLLRIYQAPSSTFPGDLPAASHQSSIVNPQ